MSQYDDDRQHSIAISVGINACSAAAANQKDPATFFKENVETFVGAALDVHETFALKAVNAALPGTTQVFVPPVTVGAPAQSTQTVAAAPSPIPGVTATDGDPKTAAIWQEFFQDKQNGKFEDNWFDNRFSKKNPAGPDFKNKKDDKKALWIAPNPKFKTQPNPSWVPEALRQSGLA